MDAGGSRCVFFRQEDIVELQTRSGHLLIFFESLALVPALCKGRSKCYIAFIHASDLCVLFLSFL